MSIFDSYKTDVWPHQFSVELHVHALAGGTPADPKVAEGWLKTKLADKDDLIRQAVMETMVDRELDADAAAEVVEQNRHLVGFKRHPEHGLYIEGRQVKAMLKEAGSIATNEGRLPNRFGGANADKNYRKGWKGWAPEHIFVIEDVIPLGVVEPSGVNQSFPKSRFGSGIQYTEFVEDAKVSFTVVTDHDFTEKEWAHIWLTAEQNGIGASRSQGFGRFDVTRWDRIAK